MRIKVLGSDVKVIMNKDLNLQEEADGIFFAEENLIEIQAGMNPNRETHVLVHEIMHALLSRIGIANVIPLELEEIICDTVPSVLLENFVLLKRDPVGDKRDNGVMGTPTKSNRTRTKSSKRGVSNGGGHRQNSLCDPSPSGKIKSPKKIS